MPLGTLTQHAEHLLMPTMHAIECPDRQHAAMMLCADVVQAAD
jgi:hypothetical protein